MQGATATKIRKSSRSYLKMNYQGYVLMIPYLLVFFTFTVWPVISAITHG